MLREEDIALDVDYNRLCTMETELLHEKNRIGEKGIVKKYRNIGRWTSNDYEYNFLCAFVRYFANRNNMKVKAVPKKLQKAVLDLLDFSELEEGRLTEEDRKNIHIGVIPEFLEAGIYLRELTELY